MLNRPLPVVDSVNGVVLQAGLKAFGVFLQVMQQTRKFRLSFKPQGAGAVSCQVSFAKRATFCRCVGTNCQFAVSVSGFPSDLTAVCA
jgi:hypothetical protein